MMKANLKDTMLQILEKRSKVPTKAVDPIAAAVPIASASSLYLLVFSFQTLRLASML